MIVEVYNTLAWQTLQSFWLLFLVVLLIDNCTSLCNWHNFLANMPNMIQSHSGTWSFCCFQLHRTRFDHIWSWKGWELETTVHGYCQESNWRWGFIAWCSRKGFKLKLFEICYIWLQCFPSSTISDALKSFLLIHR